MEENSHIPNPVAPQQGDKEKMEDAIMVLRQEKARTKTLYQGKDKNSFYQGKAPVVSFNTRDRCNCRGNSRCL